MNSLAVVVVVAAVAAAAVLLNVVAVDRAAGEYYQAMG